MEHVPAAPLTTPPNALTTLCAAQNFHSPSSTPEDNNIGSTSDKENSLSSAHLALNAANLLVQPAAISRCGDNTGKPVSFTPRKTTQPPRAWERRPATPFVPRSEGQKIWKRVPLGELGGDSAAHQQQTRPQREKRDYIRMTKRQKLEHDGPEAAEDRAVFDGAFVGTKWEEDVVDSPKKKAVIRSKHEGNDEAVNKQPLAIDDDFDNDEDVDKNTDDGDHSHISERVVAVDELVHVIRHDAKTRAMELPELIDEAPSPEESDEAETHPIEENTPSSAPARTSLETTCAAETPSGPPSQISDQPSPSKLDQRLAEPEQRESHSADGNHTNLYEGLQDAEEVLSRLPSGGTAETESAGAIHVDTHDSMPMEAVVPGSPAAPRSIRPLPSDVFLSPSLQTSILVSDAESRGSKCVSIIANASNEPLVTDPAESVALMDQPTLNFDITAPSTIDTQATAFVPFPGNSSSDTIAVPIEPSAVAVFVNTDEEDTLFLHGFLERAKASKAARDATSPQRQGMTDNLRDSIPLSTNSTEPHANNGIEHIEQVQNTHKSPLPSSKKEDDTAQQTSPVRRSARTANKPAARSSRSINLPLVPQVGPVLPSQNLPSTIQLKRASGNEFIFNAKSEPTMAMVTRANTKRNQGDAVHVARRLEQLSQLSVGAEAFTTAVQGEATSLPTVSNATDTLKSPSKKRKRAKEEPKGDDPAPRKTRARKSVAWHEMLVNYREATPDRLSPFPSQAEEFALIEAAANREALESVTRSFSLSDDSAKLVDDAECDTESEAGRIRSVKPVTANTRTRAPEKVEKDGPEIKVKKTRQIKIGSVNGTPAPKKTRSQSTPVSKLPAPVSTLVPLLPSSSTQTEVEGKSKTKTREQARLRETKIASIPTSQSQPIQTVSESERKGAGGGGGSGGGRRLRARS